MRNQFYFSIKITDRQTKLAKELVEYSMQHHTIPNIWDGKNTEKDTVELRFTGTLGEIVFADAYELPRPTRSFGAQDGQDFGMDFQLQIEDEVKNFDIKTMRRNSNVFYSNYVLNIPSSQLNKTNSLTHFYFHINIHPKGTSHRDLIASFVGFVGKEDIKNNIIGQFYKAGTMRTRADKSQFMFHESTYEINLSDLISPPLNEKISKLKGFVLKQIRP